MVHLCQDGSLREEMKYLAKVKAVNSTKRFTCICTCCNIRATGMSKHLKGIEYENKHPRILYARNSCLPLPFVNLQRINRNQKLNFLGSEMHQSYGVLNLRVVAILWTLWNSEFTLSTRWRTFALSVKGTNSKR